LVREDTNHGNRVQPNSKEANLLAQKKPDYQCISVPANFSKFIEKIIC
jgi:hypothetical protein